MEKENSYQFNSLKTIEKFLPQCDFQLEETMLFTRVEWNTFWTTLKINIPLEKMSDFEKNKDQLLNLGKIVYGRQDVHGGGENILMDVEFGILSESEEIIDFSSIKVNNIIEAAIQDAEMFMSSGMYMSAIDRIHTGFHGYLRKILDDCEISYNKTDTITQLYNKLHSKLQINSVSIEISNLIKTTIRGATGIISSINDFRNRHSLAHPNQELLPKREAELVIKLASAVSSYLSEIEFINNRF